jgi:hypothetical protein
MSSSIQAMEDTWRELDEEEFSQTNSPFQSISMMTFQNMLNAEIDENESNIEFLTRMRERIDAQTQFLMEERRREFMIEERIRIGRLTENIEPEPVVVVEEPVLWINPFPKFANGWVNGAGQNPLVVIRKPMSEEHKQKAYNLRMNFR